MKEQISTAKAQAPKLQAIEAQVEKIEILGMLE